MKQQAIQHKYMQDEWVRCWQLKTYNITQVRTCIIEYRIAENVGGGKLWRFDTNSPKFSSPNAI